MTSMLPNYSYCRVIGHGTFGYVFEAFDRTNQKRVAIKRVQKISKNISREYEILLLLKGCPHVVQIEDIFISQTDEGSHVQNIVFDYKDFTIESLIQNALKQNLLLDPAIIKKLAFQLLTGLNSMHKLSIVHRDLKPENVLVDKNHYLEICDFGSAKQLREQCLNTPYVVSQYYRAPELILSHTDYDASIDVWAAGCIISEMANLQVLFEGKSEGDQLYQIFQTLGSLPESEMNWLFSRVDHGQEIKKRFVGYQKAAPAKWRSTYAHIPDVDLFVDLLLSLLQINPKFRLNAEQALHHPYFKK